MDIIDTLIKNNELPVLFIGSGISKRYLNNYPMWKELLLYLWKKLGLNEEEFYQSLLQLQQKEKNTFNTYVQMATNLEDMFNIAFNEGKIEVDDLSTKKAFEERINPFKKEIANYFSAMDFKENIDEELCVFKKFLLNSCAIITTNYDKLIENIIDNEYTVYYKQSDLFLSNYDCGEIYKVHGSVDCPNEIIITKSDYQQFHENSVLISAKLTTLLMESPIIFLGYSLTDENISLIIKNFSKSLRPEQRGNLSDRILYIAYNEKISELQEYKKDFNEIGAHVTVIETNNFIEIYKRLLAIKQGIPVSQLRRFKERIKDLIVERGRKGTLKSLILAPSDIDNPQISDDDIVIAIGDTKTVFNMPDRLDYLKDYFFGNQEIPFSVALRFIARQNITTQVPFYKYLNELDLENSDLRPEEKERIKQRKEKYSNFENLYKGILNAYKSEFSSIAEIKALKYPENRELASIAYNITRIPRSEVEAYIMVYLNNITFDKWKKSLMSPLSKLILAWDIQYNKK